VGVVEAGHLLVPGLGVDPDHVGVLELVMKARACPMEGSRMSPLRLVGLRLDREPHRVAAVDHVVGEGVHRLAVAVERRADVLGEVDLGAFPPAQKT
jgi:hypothetical protein